ASDPSVTRDAGPGRRLLAEQQVMSCLQARITLTPATSCRTRTTPLSSGRRPCELEVPETDMRRPSAAADGSACLAGLRATQPPGRPGRPGRAGPRRPRAPGRHRVTPRAWARGRAGPGP